MDILRKRWIYAINAFIILLMTGVALAWSVFVVPLENTFHWSRTATSFAFTINVLAFPLGNMLTGTLVKTLSTKTRYQHILRLGAFMMSMGLFLSVFVSEVWHIFITYGVITGIGIGLVYNAIISVTPLWFPEKTGMITGLLLMGYAFSTSILGTLCQYIISISSWRVAFITLAIAIIIVLTMCSFLVVLPTSSQFELLPAFSSQQSNSDVDYDAKEMIKTKRFWIFFIFAICTTGPGLALMNHGPVAIVETIKASSAVGAFMLSMMSICNGVGRLIWGTLFDKLGINISIKILSFIFVFAMGLIFIASNLQISYLFIIGGCIYLFAYGGIASLSPVVTRKLYGNKNFSMNFSIMGMMCLITSFFSTIVGSIQTMTHTYMIAFITLLVIDVIGAILGFMFNENK